MTATKTATQDQPTGNGTYYTAKAIVVGFAGGCLYFSFGHTIDLAHMLGATGVQAYTAPAFIDGFMLLGRLGMSAAFDASTRLIGRRMMTVGAILSLTANVAAGHTLGDRILGALVVIGFLVSEWYAGKLKPAPKTPQQKAAATRRANAAAKAVAGAPAKSTAKPAKPKTATTKPATTKPATTKPRTPRTRKLAAQPLHPVAAIRALPANAPVSPAPGGHLTPSGLWVGSSVAAATRI